MTEIAMRERVARAIAAERDQYEIAWGLGSHPSQVWSRYSLPRLVCFGSRSECQSWIDSRCADAALAAMREPTKAMAEAARQTLRSAPGGIMFSSFAEQWHGAIDAALSEKAP